MTILAWFFLLFTGSLSEANSTNSLVALVDKAEHRIPLGLSLEASLSKQKVLAIDIPSVSCTTCTNKKIQELAQICRENDFGAIVFVRPNYSFSQVRNLHKLAGIPAAYFTLARPAFNSPYGQDVITIALFSRSGRLIGKPFPLENDGIIEIKKIITKATQ